MWLLYREYDKVHGIIFYTFKFVATESVVNALVSSHRFDLRLVFQRKLKKLLPSIVKFVL